MIVPITVPPPSGFSPKFPPSIANLGHDGLFLIELQGTLDVHGTESTAKDGQLIGTLNTADMNKPTLAIGHHLLEGRVASLPKPLGVLHKQVGDAVRWDVMAVVRKKMVFSKRPMPIAKPASRDAKR